MLRVTTLHLPPLAIRLLALAAGAVHASGATQESSAAPCPLPSRLDVKAAAPYEAAVGGDDAAERRGAAVHPEVAPATTRRAAATSRPAHPIDFTQVYFDEPGDGALWAHGETYKASFDARGFTYVPFFGSQAPRDFPVTFALESVRVGGELVELASAPVRTRSDDRVVLDHGAAVELFDLDTQGAKHELVFVSLPRAGDLCVHLALDTELAVRTGARGIELHNDLGFVAYRDALVLDAAGRSRALEIGWSEGAIELVVPEEFLAEARFPVTIDPIVTTYTVDATAADEGSPDMAFDDTASIFAVCWERVFSASDHDVWFEERTLGGTAVAGSRSMIDPTTTNWEHPRIATNTQAGQFLVVAAAGAAPARLIRGRTVDSGAPFALGTVFTINGTEGGDKLDPDVGGDPATSGTTSYCVVWTRVFNSTDRDVHARLVTPAGTAVGATVIFVDNTSGTLDVNPSISKSNSPVAPALQDWNVVWERVVVSVDGDIHGARIHRDGVLSLPSFAIDNSTNDDRRPSASPGIEIGGGLYYLVAWSRQETTDGDIRYVILDGATSVAGTQNLSTQESLYVGLASQDQVEPSAEATAQFFHVAYSEQVGASASDYDTQSSSVYFNGATPVLAEVHTTLASSTTHEGNPELASRRSGGLAGSLYYSATWEDQRAATLGDIEAAVLSVPNGGPVRSFCTGAGSACPCAAGAAGNGCPNSFYPGGANLASSGAASVSGDDFVLLGTSMPNSTAVYYQGSVATSQTVIDDGTNCAGGTIVRLGTKLNSHAASQYPEPGDPTISVRGQIPATAGVSRYYQCFYRNAAAFCTPATSNRTNALHVIWLP